MIMNYYLLIIGILAIVIIFESLFLGFLLGKKGEKR